MRLQGEVRLWIAKGAIESATDACSLVPEARGPGTMSLSELHPLNDGEIAKLPAKPGVYVLFRIQIPVQVDSASNLRRDVQSAKARASGATHFAAEVLEPEAIDARLADLRKQL